MAWAFLAGPPQPEQKKDGLEALYERDAQTHRAQFVPYQAPTEQNPTDQEPNDEVAPQPLTPPQQPTPLAQGQSVKRRRVTYKPATLVVVTNFEKANIRVNGLTYPAQTEPGQHKGMVLPAGGPYTVEVTYDGKQRKYTLSLRPYETRYLVVELSGYQAAKSVAKAPAAIAPKPKPAKKDEDGTGRITVYAKPRGIVILDGKDTGKKAPNTVTAELGRHEVQVRYTDGEVSEKKIVRVRKNSRIKLFFRQRKKK